MPNQCLGHRCSCGASWFFGMSDFHRRDRHLSAMQAGCCNVQYNPAYEYCSSRPIVTCPDCSPQVWNGHELLGINGHELLRILDRIRISHSVAREVETQAPPAVYIRPGHSQFIGPMPPPPCGCEACGG